MSITEAMNKAFVLAESLANLERLTGRMYGAYTSGDDGKVFVWTRESVYITERAFIGSIDDALEWVDAECKSKGI